MIKLGMTFKWWLLATTFLIPVSALARISLSKTTVRRLEAEARAKQRSSQEHANS